MKTIDEKLIKINPNRHDVEDKMLYGTYFIGQLDNQEYVFLLTDERGNEFINEFLNYKPQIVHCFNDDWFMIEVTRL